MANVLRKSTGLTGLPVNKHPIRTLTELYARILRTMTVLPENYEYRIRTEKSIREKLNIVNKCRTVEEVEAQLKDGVIEESIDIAKKEAELSRRMLTYKPWEPLIQKAPEDQWIWPPHQ